MTPLAERGGAAMLPWRGTNACLCDVGARRSELCEPAMLMWHGPASQHAAMDNRVLVVRHRRSPRVQALAAAVETHARYAQSASASAARILARAHSVDTPGAA